MDVRKWPMERIMQLPDWCFGRRWWMGVHLFESTGQPMSVFMEEKPPDRFILWAVFITVWGTGMVDAFRITLRLTAELLPVAPGPVPQKRLLFGISTPAEVYEFKVPPNDYLFLHDIRQFVEAPMENVCVLCTGDLVNHFEATAAILISSVPREVPDWLVSGQGSHLA